ncbi:hypothetical protein [Microbacterium sp.]|jgi:hypothetical protein|uniref:hypothetical protein n=1 Tax=Microbacterium sp. TaxID=51671 RepID=UPI0037CC1F94
MDNRTVLHPNEKTEMRGLVLAGAARADSIRRRRAQIAVSASAVVVVAGIAVGAGFASGVLGRGSVVPVAPAPATSIPSATSPGVEPSSIEGIVAFERPATPEDVLPALPDYATEEVLVETARYVGEYEDVGFWLVQSDRPGSVCIVMWPLDARTNWSTGCGGMTVAVEGVAHATLAPAGMAPEGWVQLDENLSVKPSSLGSDLG